MVKKVLMSLVTFYRNYLKILMLPACRFYPSCSEYAQQAIEKYGALKGTTKTAMRVLKCNPLNKGGYDPA